jgi:hypothetical protein
MLDEITITLRDKWNVKHDVFIDVGHSSLSEKWLIALNKLLKNNLHLEKNYHWIGFQERHLPLLCDKINDSLNAIKSFDWTSVGLAPQKEM